MKAATLDIKPRSTTSVRPIQRERPAPVLQIELELPLVAPDAGDVQVEGRQHHRRQPERPTLGQKFEDDLTIAYRGKKGGLPPFFANLVPEQGGELRPILAAHLGIPVGDDITLLERLGRDRWVHFRKRRLPNGYNITTLVDVSEQKKQEEEQKRKKMQTEVNNIKYTVESGQKMDFGAIHDINVIMEYNRETFEISSDSARELLGTVYIPGAKFLVTGTKPVAAASAAKS